jgi:saccharopine dehydrogenase-like NADP-dependent oxidoreductase
MKHILLFGAGKSATVLIAYLIDVVQKESWHLTVVDANLELVQKKLEGASNTTAASFDIADATPRQCYIEQADIVISLLPPALHILVAKDCIKYKKNLLTASYVDGELKKLQPEIEEVGLLFLCEMGLDPGIDHMSAMQLIDAIHNDGGKIISFYSHCGGLVAPESDDNPWHYKISWNPRNVVLAGKAGAVYKLNGIEKKLDYAELFSEKRFTTIPGLGPLCWYPNRDSLSYLHSYNLPDCHTFIRTTLRHPDFIYGWKNVIDLQLTDETVQYMADGKSLKTLFKEHLDKHYFDNWLEQRLQEQLFSTKNLLSELMDLTAFEQNAETAGKKPIEEFMLVDKGGDLKEIAIEDLKLDTATALADRMHDASLTLKQLFFLGLNDAETQMRDGTCSAADILQYALEKKLALGNDDKDMVVMKHEIEFEQDQEMYKKTSTLVVKGQNNRHTAMAKTVGLPLGIAATLILKGMINCTGLQIPVSKEIYEPVLAELAHHDIQFREEKEQVS